MFTNENESEEVPVSKTKPKAICFIGPSGAGKGVQSEKLLQFLSFYAHVPTVRIQSGEILRKIAAEPGNRYYESVDIALSAGRFVSPKLMIAILGHEIQRYEGLPAVFVFDGSPRTKREWRWLRKRFDILAIWLIASRESITRRLLERGRKDDTPELIESRIEEFNKFSGSALSEIQENAKTFFLQSDSQSKAATFMMILPKVMEFLGRTKLKMYLAHKYTDHSKGQESQNAINASYVSELLRTWGYMVFNPLGNSHPWFRKNVEHESEEPRVARLSRRYAESYYEEDNEFLAFCDIVAVASDFGESKGVQAEIALGKGLHKPVYFIQDVGKD